MSLTDAMRVLLDKLYGSFASGDATGWIDHIADEIIGIGTDPNEWWEGRSLVAEVVATQLREMSGTGVRLTSGEPRIVEYGSVVWSVDRPVLHLADGNETPMRVTIIAVAEGETLRIKHFHYSVGSANEEVFQQELTTE